MTEPSRLPGLTARDLAVAGVMNLMWGLNLVAVKMAVDLAEPLAAAWLRQAMVAIICLPALKLVPGKMRELVALGLLSGALFYIFVNLSLQVSDNVGALAIAGQLAAPFSLVMAVVFLGERIHKARIGGMVLAFAGVVLLVFDPAMLDEIPGLLLTTGSALIWAICSLIQRRLIGVPVLTIYAWVGIIGSCALFPVAWAFEHDAMAAIPSLPASNLGWILFSALGSTVIGQGAMSWLLQRHPVSTVVPLSLLSPVISVVAAALYFHRPLTPVMIAAGITVMVGVAIVTIRTAQAQEGQGTS